MIQARPYQQRMIDQARAGILAGVKRQLLVLPTGGGKGAIAAIVMDGAAARGSHVLFVVHRYELLEQVSGKLDGLGVPHGIIQGNHPRFRPYLPVQVASVQTLVRRITAGKVRLTPNLIFVDEAHHARAASYQGVLDAFPSAAVLGLTATPCRIDGKGLGELFQKLILGPSVRELTDLGYLVPARGFTYDVPDLRGVRTSAGDYNLAQLDDAMGKVILSGDYVTEYQAHTAGKRALVFAVNVKHSKAIVEHFQQAGIPAEHVDDETGAEQRAAALERLRKGETLILSNVGLFTEGTDLPMVEVVILARPTKSLALALQMFGRGLRPFCFTCWDAPSSGCATSAHHLKQHCLIHDHAGVILDHGLPEADRKWSLDPDQKPGAAPVRRCPRCFCVNPASNTVCSECGAQLRNPGEANEREIATVAGDKVDLDELRSRLGSLAQERAAKGLPELAPLALERVANATLAEKGAEFLRLRRMARWRNLPGGWVGKSFERQFGHKPEFDEEFLKGLQPAKQAFVSVAKGQRFDDAEPVSAQNDAQNAEPDLFATESA